MPPTPKLKASSQRFRGSQTIQLSIYAHSTPTVGKMSSVCNQAFGDSTRSCIADKGSSFAPGPSNVTPESSRSGNRVCIASGTSSGVICLVSSGLGGARKLFPGGLRGLSNFSKTESRFFKVNSSDARAWPNPCDAATCSIDLKYCFGLAACS